MWPGIRYLLPFSTPQALAAHSTGFTTFKLWTHVSYRTSNVLGLQSALLFFHTLYACACQAADPGALDAAKDLLDKVLIADFFAVLAILAWLGAGVAAKVTLQSSVRALACGPAVLRWRCSRSLSYIQAFCC